MPKVTQGIRTALDELREYANSLAPQKGMFSTLDELIQQAPFEKAPYDEWANYLKPGRMLKRGELQFPLKQEEMDYTLKPFLDQMQSAGVGHVVASKEGMLERLRSSRPTFGLTFHSDEVTNAARDAASAKGRPQDWEDRVGEVVPDPSPDQLDWDRIRLGAPYYGPGNGEGFERLWHTSDFATDYQESITRMPDAVEHGQHFDPDTISHSRVSIHEAPGQVGTFDVNGTGLDRTGMGGLDTSNGGRVRLVDEIQSDLHQDALDKQKNTTYQDYITPEETEEISRLKTERYQLKQQRDSLGLSWNDERDAALYNRIESIGEQITAIEAAADKRRPRRGYITNAEKDEYRKLDDERKDFQSDTALDYLNTRERDDYRDALMKLRELQDTGRVSGRELSRQGTIDVQNYLESKSGQYEQMAQARLDAGRQKRERYLYLQSRLRNGVSDAPFKDPASYGRLELRKQLLQAAHSGEDWLALTTGADQVERNNLTGKKADTMTAMYDKIYRGELEKLAKQYGAKVEMIDMPTGQQAADTRPPFMRAYDLEGADEARSYLNADGLEGGLNDLDYSMMETIGSDMQDAYEHMWELHGRDRKTYMTNRMQELLKENEPTSSSPVPKWDHMSYKDKEAAQGRWRDLMNDFANDIEKWMDYSSDPYPGASDLPPRQIKTFPAIRITPEVRERIKRHGAPLFARGGVVHLAGGGKARALRALLDDLRTRADDIMRGAGTERKDLVQKYTGGDRMTGEELHALNSLLHEGELPRMSVYRGAEDVERGDQIPISTSLDFGIAQDFAHNYGGKRYINKIYVPEGAPGMYLGDLPYNYHRSEREVLLPGDSQSFTLLHHLEPPVSQKDLARAADKYQILRNSDDAPEELIRKARDEYDRIADLLTRWDDAKLPHMVYRLTPRKPSYPLIPYQRSLNLYVPPASTLAKWSEIDKHIKKELDPNWDPEFHGDIDLDPVPSSVWNEFKNKMKPTYGESEMPPEEHYSDMDQGYADELPLSDKQKLIDQNKAIKAKDPSWPMDDDYPPETPPGTWPPEGHKKDFKYARGGPVIDWLKETAQLAYDHPTELGLAGAMAGTGAWRFYEHNRQNQRELEDYEREMEQWRQQHAGAEPMYDDRANIAEAQDARARELATHHAPPPDFDPGAYLSRLGREGLDFAGTLPRHFWEQLKEQWAALSDNALHSQITGHRDVVPFLEAGSVPEGQEPVIDPETGMILNAPYTLHEPQLIRNFRTLPEQFFGDKEHPSPELRDLQDIHAQMMKSADLDEPRGLLQNLAGAAGATVGQLPVPGGFFSKLAGRLPGAAKVAGYVPAKYLDFLGPTMHPSAGNYLSASGVGGGLNFLTEGREQRPPPQDLTDEQMFEIEMKLAEMAKRDRERGMAKGGKVAEGVREEVSSLRKLLEEMVGGEDKNLPAEIPKAPETPAAMDLPALRQMVESMDAPTGGPTMSRRDFMVKAAQALGQAHAVAGALDKVSLPHVTMEAPATTAEAAMTATKTPEVQYFLKDFPTVSKMFDMINNESYGVEASPVYKEAPVPTAYLKNFMTAERLLSRLENKKVADIVPESVFAKHADDGTFDLAKDEGFDDALGNIAAPVNDSADIILKHAGASKKDRDATNRLLEDYFDGMLKNFIDNPDQKAYTSLKEWKADAKARGLTLEKHEGIPHHYAYMGIENHGMFDPKLGVGQLSSPEEIAQAAERTKRREAYLKESDRKVGRPVKLPANEEEGWPEEHGHIVSIDKKSETAIVAVNKEHRTGPEDDGLREVGLNDLVEDE